MGKEEQLASFDVHIQTHHIAAEILHTQDQYNEPLGFECAAFIRKTKMGKIHPEVLLILQRIQDHSENQLS